MNAARIDSRAWSALSVGEHIYHPAGPHASVRNAILGSMPIGQLYDRMTWLWAGNGTESQAA